MKIIVPNLKISILIIGFCYSFSLYAMPSDNKYLSTKQIQQMQNEFIELADNGRLKQPQVMTSFLKRYYFSCTPSAWNHSNKLTSKPITCDVYLLDDPDPSPWPIMSLGIENQKLVAASTDILTSSAKWSCQTVQSNPVCFYRPFTKVQRKNWINRWQQRYSVAD